MIPARTLPQPAIEIPSNGAQLVAPDGRALPLLSAALLADAEGGVARVVVEQRFRNPYPEPLAVTYSLPLPADGAVSGFSFRIGGRRVVGEIDRKKEARERYERALVEGRTAAILEQDRSSLFTQEIGNIPPGEEIVAEISVDQRLRWLEEGAWEWRFPTVVAPRYLGEPGRVPDAARVMQDVSELPLPARISLACRIHDSIADGRRPESPSHAIDAVRREDGVWVELRDSVRLDRDVVVRWAVATPKVGISLATGRRAGAGYGLLTVVPPSSEAGLRPVSRDLIVLLDTSGSMGGEPLDQARRVVSALIDTLREGDQLELIEFSSAARRWKSEPVSATASARREAQGWLRGLRASGGTEMRTGILTALGALRPWSQRQVVLVTDGQIGFESQVVAAICDRLPASARLHTVGVGSAVNRSLTGPAARAGRGIEVVVGLGEDPERAADRLVARTTDPLLVELSVTGDALIEHAPRRLPDLFAGAPALIGVALRAGGGELQVRGRTAAGSFEQRIHVRPIAAESGSQAVVALFGREAVEDRELELAAGGDLRDINAAVERLGLDFQIATRLTSWVAVSHGETVDPRDALRRERMPHEIPHGASVEGLGLRAPAKPVFLGWSRAEDGASMVEQTKSKIELNARLGKAKPSLADDDETFRPKMAMPLAARPAGPPRPSALIQPQPTKELAEDGGMEQQKKGGGLLGAVRRIFGGKRDEAEGAPPPAPPTTGRRLRGRIALHKDGDLVIEVTVEGAALAWDPEGRVEITLVDGWIVEATVEASRSTRAGNLSPGQTARLTLRLPARALAGTPREIALKSGASRLIIEV